LLKFSAILPVAGDRMHDEFLGSVRIKEILGGFRGGFMIMYNPVWYIKVPIIINWYFVQIKNT